MSLRDEIYQLMLKARSWDEIEGQDSIYYTNEIIKLFENLIDKKRKYYESFYSDDKEYFGTIVIDEIKNELLK